MQGVRRKVQWQRRETKIEVTAWESYSAADMCIPLITVGVAFTLLRKHLGS